ncbi:hypothetical protein ACFVVM_19175 [Nocardia sp. NPDC058176]|uniref:hypothetical protein n=1 Tax=Nocardia sp. NPDC058176 TaxID=3346368 RepID=UPI0036DDA0AD
MCTDDRRCERCPARRIGAGPRVVAAALPALGTVVSVTANDAALLSHTGEYQPPALPGEALRCGDQQIALRVHPGLVSDTVLTERALTMANATGTHRAYLTPLSDRLVVEALESAPVAEPETADALDWSSVNWSEADQITHLDDLTPERYRVLPFTGARRVDARVFPHLLTHLSDMSLAYTVAVPGGGCVQLHRGPAAFVEHTSSHVSVIFGAARYAVDPSFVAECWVTQAHGVTGTTSSVELYDHSNRCVTVLTQTGPVCHHLHEAWEAVVASLPADEQ